MNAISYDSDLYECPICSENYTQGDALIGAPHSPILLVKCGHSVCSSCVSRINNSSQVQCPICRKAYNGNADVARHFFLERMVLNRSVGSSVAARAPQIQTPTTPVIKVFRTLGKVAVRLRPDSEKSGNMTGVIIEVGKVVSGCLCMGVSNGEPKQFLHLESNEGYLPIQSSDFGPILTVLPAQTGVFLGRVLNADVGLSLRKFPDYDPEGTVVPSVTIKTNTVVVGHLKVQGEHGDVFLRITDSQSGRSGWLFETRNRDTVMKAINPASLLKKDSGTDPMSTASLAGSTDISVESAQSLAERFLFRTVFRSEECGVVGFTDGRNRINVYYHTGTVSLLVTADGMQPTQLFRSKCTLSCLESIFRAPQLLFGVQDKYFPELPHHLAVLPVLAEDSEMEREMKRLSSEVESTMKSFQIVSEQHRQLRDEVWKLKARDLNKKQEDEQKLQQRREETLEQNRLLSRGKSFDYELVYRTYFPKDMDKTRCIAIGDGGFVSVSDTGCCAYHGIPADVIEYLERQHSKNIRYISLGPDGEYYVSKTNGKAVWSSNLSPALSDYFLQIDLEWIAFGPNGSYFVVSTDGLRQWVFGFSAGAQAIVSNASNKIHSVWLGNCGAYFISYQDARGNDRISYRDLPRDIIPKVAVPGRKVTQLLIDESRACYFIRYSD